MRTESLILKIILYFNIFTLVMYIITPLSINSGYHLLNILYISINILMMKFGFDCGLRRKISNTVKPTVNIFAKKYGVILIFYLVTFSLRYSYSLYLPPLDFDALVNRITIGISDPYLGRQFLHGSRTLPWAVYFLTSIVDSVFFIVFLINWKQLKYYMRLIVMILLLIDVLYWMGSGTNFGVIMLVSCVFLAVMMQIDQQILSLKKIVRIILIGIIAFTVAIFVFSYNMEGRSGGDFTSLKGSDFLALGQSVSVDTNFYFDLFPYRFQVLLLFVFSYLTQGYVFLENIYDLDFHWGGFCGNNPALQSFASDFLGFNPEINSYQMQMERLGVDSYVNWHSCYLWLANDFTLLFVPLIVFFIAKFVSYALVLYRKNHDVLSGVVFIVLANMLLFMFANNNYLSSVFYSFMFIFPYWYITKYKHLSYG